MIMKDIQDKLTQCEINQQELWSYRPLSPETLQSLKGYYRVGTTFTSNALEGNSLTESETKVIIEEILLDTIKQNPGLNAPSLSKRLGRSLRTTQRYLKKLSDSKQIVFKGVAKNGGYESL